jgi:hypothetical protein
MHLHIEEAENMKSYISLYSLDGCCVKPLFHGTRMYALQASEEDRKRFHTACDRIISFAKEMFINCPIDDNALMEYQRAKNLLFLSTVVHQYKTAAYEYGSFYITTSYPTAITYANNCGGELGQWAYAQCIGFQDFQIDLDTQTRDAVAIVMEEYQKYKNSEPIILVFNHVRFADLKTERGGPFLTYDKDGNPDEEYNAFSIEMLHKTKVTDHLTFARAYRLMQPNTYTARLVRQKDFKKGLSLFTEIRDVDKYLKWNDSKCLRDLL